MWWKHVKFTIVILLLFITFIPATLVYHLLGHGRIFKSFSEVKELWDEVKTTVYIKE